MRVYDYVNVSPYKNWIDPPPTFLRSSVSPVRARTTLDRGLSTSPPRIGRRRNPSSREGACGRRISSHNPPFFFVLLLLFAGAFFFAALEEEVARFLLAVVVLDARRWTTTWRVLCTPPPTTTTSRHHYRSQSHRPSRLVVVVVLIEVRDDNDPARYPRGCSPSHSSAPRTRPRRRRCRSVRGYRA